MHHGTSNPVHWVKALHNYVQYSQLCVGSVCAAEVILLLIFEH